MNRRAVVAVLAAAAFGAGCAEVPTGPDAQFAVGDRNSIAAPQAGIVNVCAFMPDYFPAERSYAATFTATASAGDVFASQFGIANDLTYGSISTCFEAWNATSGVNAVVSATLQAAPGLVLDRIVTLVGTGVEDNVSQVIFGSNTGSVTVNNVIGGSIWFKFEPRDDPPPTGGEGCTPGYWKQSQHFGSWVGYAPSQLFSSVFANAFPGQTLLQVLSLNGGGLNALGRHAVAALLNASSSNVNYDLSVEQVVNAFNAAYASGNKKTIEQQKDLFDMLNNQGCPLGRAP